ncbi:MAG: hypothetical protein IPH43_08315 [Xanthomonadales bacterium]|nr:hypothetical protein [Xanthomonadales bacterium]
MLQIAALLIALLGLAHSVLGERYILVRLFRRDLPKLFGGTRFTRNTLRFAWHLTTMFAWGISGSCFSSQVLPRHKRLRRPSAGALCSRACFRLHSPEGGIWPGWYCSGQVGCVSHGPPPDNSSKPTPHRGSA